MYKSAGAQQTPNKALKACEARIKALEKENKDLQDQVDFAEEDALFAEYEEGEKI